MTKQTTEIFNKTTTRIKSIAFHPTNPVMITANHCGTVYIWNYLYQQIIASFSEHTGSVRVVKIHPSGELFATAGDDHLVRIWNYKTRKVVKILKGHSDYVRCLDFHPTKPWVITGSDDCTIKIWNFYTGDMLSTSCGHTHYIMSVLFLDTTHILTASLDHTMGLWSCANLFEKKKFMVPDVVVCQIIEAHDRGVNCMYLHNGKVISGSDDREIKIWKYTNENLTLEKSLTSHEGNVNGVYFDGETVYGGGDDSMLSSFIKGKTTKLFVDSRIWCINGRDDYIAVGTDNGLIVYRKSISLSYFIADTNIFYSIGCKVHKYNSKQDLDLFTTKEEVTGIFKHKELLYVNYHNRYEVFNGTRKDSGDIGSIAFVEDVKYTLKNSTLFKNDTIYRADIDGKLISSNKCIFIVDKKAITRIVNDSELSSNFNFNIKTVAFNDKNIAIIGPNKILIADLEFNILETINELVEITGGFFYEDMFIYTTLKHIKFFYQDTGILQSIETYCLPISISDNYLLIITSNGLEKILLNLAEIRFRRAVFKDENILKVIEEEQLPGLSPLEYLINKDRGGIALPYIKNEDKRFQLFLNDKNFNEALKLCSNPKMCSELAFAALEHEKYDISEICFKKNQDHLNLFYLYLSTKQFDKMKDLEGDDVENMVKIVYEDNSVLPFESKFVNLKEIREALEKEKGSAYGGSCYNSKVVEKYLYNSTESSDKYANKDLASVKDGASSTNYSQEELITKKKMSNLNIKAEDVLINEPSSEEKKKQKGPFGDKNNSGKSSEQNTIQNSSLDSFSKKVMTTNQTICSVSYSDQKQIRTISSLELANIKSTSDEQVYQSAEDTSDDKSINSDTDVHVSAFDNTNGELINDSVIDEEEANHAHSKIFNLSDIRIPDAIKSQDYQTFYQKGIEFTTQGKFIKAVENFKTAITIIALKIQEPTDFLEVRKKIGNYFLGLYVEKRRKSVEDPILSMQMSLFFASLSLEPAHILLVKNLALTTCFKNGNYKTAKNIAMEFPMCRNAKKAIECEEDVDTHEVINRPFFYGSLCFEPNSKECALCGVKTKEAAICPACGIGCLH